MQRYCSIWEFKKVHRLCWPTTEEWRLTTPKMGAITALPGTRGLLVATNGILCFIELEDGSIFEGHIEWFIPDKKVLGESKTAKKRKARAEYLKSLETEYV